MYRTFCSRFPAAISFFLSMRPTRCLFSFLQRDEFLPLSSNYVQQLLGSWASTKLDESKKWMTEISNSSDSNIAGEDKSTLILQTIGSRVLVSEIRALWLVCVFPWNAFDFTDWVTAFGCRLSKQQIASQHLGVCGTHPIFVEGIKELVVQPGYESVAPRLRVETTSHVCWVREPSFF